MPLDAAVGSTRLQFRFGQLSLIYDESFHKGGGLENAKLDFFDRSRNNPLQGNCEILSLGTGCNLPMLSWKSICFDRQRQIY
jgi:hypothetical protein